MNGLNLELDSTNIEFLKESSVSCGSVEELSIKALCGHAAMFPDNEEMICKALDDISKRLEYDSRRDFLKYAGFSTAAATIAAALLLGFHPFIGL